jgi:N-acetylglucosamine-6-phosphate deacetylase
MSTLFINGTLYTSNKIFENGRMLVNTLGHIEAIGGSELEAASDARIQDLKGATVLPGFIDVHVHAADG